MTAWHTVHGQLHTPYRIYVRCGDRLSDNELLQQLGLQNYRKVKTQSTGPYAVVADAGDWKLVADDWYYTLWHQHRGAALTALGSQFELFAYAHGDCDRSFDFQYFRDGGVVRKCVVSDPKFNVNNRVVIENIGEPFAAERSALETLDEDRAILEIARSLGLRTDFQESELRIYAPAVSWFQRLRSFVRR